MEQAAAVIDWGGTVLASTVLAAVVSGVVALVTTWLTMRFNRERLRREYQLEYATETAIHELLSRPDWRMRGFAQIKQRLGGFDDDALRQHLVRAGAVRFKKAGTHGDGDNELWGLRERNEEALKAE
jgi:hypothetical protein